MTRFDCFAIAAPGLEGIVCAELRALGIDAKAVEGGAEWNGELESVYRANLWLRSATRVIVRLAEFKAKAFYELERHAKKVPWEVAVQKGRPVRLRVTCKKSRLYHSDAVAERLARSIENKLGAESVFTSESDRDDHDADGGAREPEQLFIARLNHDTCTISADASGALLHMRGYRGEAGKAPLRETLAAALLLGAGWTGETPLLDPMCGSGTIAIEGAMIARRIAPGLKRRFAVVDWPVHDAATWRRVHAEAEAAALPASPVRIVASDRDQGAIDSANANAEKAGVKRDIEFSVKPLSAAEPPPGVGLLATNPPYGVRIGDPAELRNLYAAVGNLARRKAAGWTLAMYVPDARLGRAVGLPLDIVAETRNGGLAVTLATSQVPVATGA